MICAESGFALSTVINSVSRNSAHAERFAKQIENISGFTNPLTCTKSEADDVSTTEEKLGGNRFFSCSCSTLMREKRSLCVNEKYEYASSLDAWIYRINDAKQENWACFQK